MYAKFPFVLFFFCENKQETPFNCLLESEGEIEFQRDYCEQGTTRASRILLEGDLPGGLLWHGPKNLLLIS